MKIRVAIVEDQKDYKEDLIKIIDSCQELNCVANFSNGKSFLRGIFQYEVDIVLMDINLPDKNGFECIYEIKDKKPDLIFLMHTIFEDDDDLKKALGAGARGYVVKGEPKEVLHQAIINLVRFKKTMELSPVMAKKLLVHFGADYKNRLQFYRNDKLTPRQMLVLKLVAEGNSYRKVGEILGIAEDTVREHMDSITSKLGVKGKVAAIREYFTRFFKK